MPIRYVLLVSRQGNSTFECLFFFVTSIYILVGKLRLAKWFIPLSPKAKAKIVQDLTQLTLSRRQHMCNFLEYKGILILFCTTWDLMSLPGEKVCVFLIKIHTLTWQNDAVHTNRSYIAATRHSSSSAKLQSKIMN